nr:cupin domain-containing protein [uncultured Anaeromusa sp.]
MRKTGLVLLLVCCSWYFSTLTAAEAKAQQTADEYIAALQLVGHVEGGYFKELYKNQRKVGTSVLPDAYSGERPLASTIYYLLKSGGVSQFHQLLSDEIWFYHDGSPLVLHMITPAGELTSVRLGLDVANGEKPQVLVPAQTIFGAEVAEKGSFGLVSCMVSPGFDYRDFRLCSYEELMRQYPAYAGVIERLNGKRQ